MDNNILVLYPSSESLPLTIDIETDEILISTDVYRKLDNFHRLPNRELIVPRCADTFPKTVCLLDHTFEQAILLYRQLFYSTWEVSSGNFNTKKLVETLNHINQWTFDSTPVIIDYGGAFETGHLHLIQYLFPKAIIYSIDTLYKELDLVVFKINEDETKWCIIPIFSYISEENASDLINCLSQELTGKSSASNNLEIFQMEFFNRIHNINVYDPYSEILSFEKIHFVDSLQKCPHIPCCVFMAYDTHHMTPTIDKLNSLGLIDYVHTKVDMDYANGHCTMCNGYLIIEKEARPIVCNLFVDLHQKLPKQPNFYPLPRTNQINWLHSNYITKFLRGKRLIVPQSNFNDPMVHSFYIKNTELLWNVDCLNLTPLLIKENIETVTSSIVQQFIEQYVDDYWKDNNSILQGYPRHFVQGCLQELVGPVNNLRIYIQSERDVFYVSDFAKQLKKEGPNVYLEYSLTDYVKSKITTLHESAIILVFEFKQNYILVYGELDRFSQHISIYTSLEQIRNRIESSVVFIDTSGHKQDVKWHQNLSFVYTAAYQESLIKQTKDQLLQLGLEDINFKSKQLIHFDYNELSKPFSTNQAIVCLNYSPYPNLDYEPIPVNLLDKWIYDKEKGKFTGVVVIVYPNVPTYFPSVYPQIRFSTNVGHVYSLRCEKILILIQWRT
ncbi:hypothetical protein I4U23_022205 [Adineta vaga]|nr:hypothetical protein I4U23_022205 [Adineta vaga]